MQKLTPLAIALILVPIFVVVLKLDHSSVLADLINSPVFWVPLVLVLPATGCVFLVLRFTTWCAARKHPH